MLFLPTKSGHRLPFLYSLTTFLHINCYYVVVWMRISSTDSHIWTLGLEAGFGIKGFALIWVCFSCYSWGCECSAFCPCCLLRCFLTMMGFFLCRTKWKLSSTSCLHHVFYPSQRKTTKTSQINQMLIYVKLRISIISSFSMNRHLFINPFLNMKDKLYFSVITKTQLSMLCIWSHQRPSIALWKTTRKTIRN